MKFLLNIDLLDHLPSYCEAVFQQGPLPAAEAVPPAHGILIWQSVPSGISDGGHPSFPHEVIGQLYGPSGSKNYFTKSKNSFAVTIFIPQNSFSFSKC